MKRLNAGVVAVATALSLSTAVATAAETPQEPAAAQTGSAQQDSNSSDQHVSSLDTKQTLEALRHLTEGYAKHKTGVPDAVGSTIAKGEEFASSEAKKLQSSDIPALIELAQSDAAGSASRAFLSSIYQDKKNDWAPGTSLDIFVGTSIAALVLAIFGGGLAAAKALGFKLPF
ncbi:hypothetical protein G7Y31_00510 [Corynebacterium lizhenjunii]|uniref:Secreted protein n=1 Tax=Corynebacterium lizhenjunii TaxID=2709394 RepID=A0A7T0KIQ0_9CORY|nr:hypothetical protein [Corynebacterium lizhenjunii]QPK80448.1 hypothetical protein G7Y31_00510 [Corynebacterium lizhenjunii]